VVTIDPAPTDPVFSLLKPRRLTSIVDVGANPIDGDPPYKPMLQRGLCRVLGFEPQKDALDELNRRKSGLETYLPHVLGDGEEATLHICSAPGMTSLLQPNPEMLRHFHHFSQWGTVTERRRVSTRRLDDLAEVEEIDFLKIDAQGSELSVFRHGKKKLSRAVAVQTEVSFVPLYENQPIFGEVDLELRSLGFLPHAFVAVNRRMIAPLVGDDPYGALHQLLEADAVYVRDFTRTDDMDAEQIKHLALIAHHLYHSFDLTMFCIDRLARRGEIDSNACDKYIAHIRQ
jgi:FkbM family methyltransferase